MIWNCLIFCCCLLVLAAICIMKIVTFLLKNMFNIYKFIPHLYKCMVWFTDFASQLTMSIEQIFCRTCLSCAPNTLSPNLHPVNGTTYVVPSLTTFAFTSMRMSVFSLLFVVTMPHIDSMTEESGPPQLFHPRCVVFF